MKQKQIGYKFKLAGGETAMITAPSYMQALEMVAKLSGIVFDGTNEYHPLDAQEKPLSVLDSCA